MLLLSLKRVERLAHLGSVSALYIAKTVLNRNTGHVVEMEKRIPADTETVSRNSWVFSHYILRDTAGAFWCRSQASLAVRKASCLDSVSALL